MDKTTQIIINLMESHGINAHQLEINASLSISSIQAWKNGKAKPSVDALIKIADYFGVSVDYLLGHEVKEKSPLAERPTLDIADKFMSEFGSLLSDSKFIDLTKLFNAMNEAQRTFTLARTVGYLNGVGVNTQAIVGY